MHAGTEQQHPLKLSCRRQVLGWVLVFLCVGGSVCPECVCALCQLARSNELIVGYL